MHSALLVVLALALSCNAVKVITNEAGAATLNETIKLGETYQLSLKSNPTTGFRWELKTKPLYSERTSVDEFGEFIEPSTDQMGAPGKQIFTFLGKNAGEEHIELSYERPWTKEGSKSLDVLIRIVVA